MKTLLLFGVVEKLGQRQQRLGVRACSTAVNVLKNQV